MTSIEAYELLKNRVEWELPLDAEYSYLVFGTPESGRFLQEEHSSVRIPIIKETIFDIDLSNDDFQIQLEYLKKKAILQMLHDVFSDQNQIKDTLISENLQLFDYAIILKNTSNTIFNILNSSRINLTSKVNEENIKRWFIDLNGLSDSENGVYVQGFIERYKREIKRLRKVLELSNRGLKIITAR